MSPTQEATRQLITYHFAFPNGTTRAFQAELDMATLQLVQQPRTALPGWTQMASFACPHCPLRGSEVVHCPTAVSLLDLLEFFGGIISHDPAHITVETPQRTYSKSTSVQAGVSGLLGLYMATSGCPVTARLKPMARFHLPFATLDETNYRALTMYVLGQFLVARQGGQADTSLHGLAVMYEDIHRVNVNVAQKLEVLRLKDASLNALAILDSFASFTSFSITHELLDEIELLFEAYLHSGQ